MRKLRTRIGESFHLLLFIISKILTFFIKEKDLWLISERGHEARDNAYVFFRFLVLNYPHINAWYIIDHTSPDIEKLSFAKTRIIDYGSFKHYCFLSRAKYLISTHIMGFSPDINLFTSLDRHFRVFRNQKRVFLQHGIIKDDIPFLYAENVTLDLFCCGGWHEYNYILENYHHPKDVVKYTGLARYDLLNSFSSKKQVLIMPTWRLYLNKDSFEDSELFLHYKQLLTSPLLSELLQQYGYEVVFYPHYEMQTYIQSFRRLKVHHAIHIAGFEYDVQQLLKESCLLITDYSSVYFDMAYMHKPVLFYHFDEQKFRQDHYKRGYFYESSIGVISYNLASLLVHLEEALQSSCKLDDKYISYIDSFFKYRDSNNCERIFESICNLS